MNSNSEDLDTRYTEVGLLLKTKRQELNLEIEQIAKEAKMDPAYIEMIEEGLHLQASERAYPLGYIGFAARMFGVPHEAILDYLCEDASGQSLAEAVSGNGKLNQAKESAGSHMQVIRANHIKAIRCALFALLAAICGIFFIIKLFNHNEDQISHQDIVVTP